MSKSCPRFVPAFQSYVVAKPVDLFRSKCLLPPDFSYENPCAQPMAANERRDGVWREFSRLLQPLDLRHEFIGKRRGDVFELPRRKRDWLPGTIRSEHGD